MLLHLLFLVDYILVLAVIGSWSYDVVTKQKQKRARCFVPAAAVFHKRIDSTVDTQKILLAALVEIQKRQIDATKLGL